MCVSVCEIEEREILVRFGGVENNRVSDFFL